MNEYIYCIYLGKDKSSIGPIANLDVLLLACGWYHINNRFNKSRGDYFYARSNYCGIE